MDEAAAAGLSGGLTSPRVQGTRTAGALRLIGQHQFASMEIDRTRTASIDCRSRCERTRRHPRMQCRRCDWRCRQSETATGVPGREEMRRVRQSHAARSRLARPSVDVLLTLVLSVALLSACGDPPSQVSPEPSGSPATQPGNGWLPSGVQHFVLTYRAWDGALRTVVLLLPNSYHQGSTQALPVVISPHGREETCFYTARHWGTLPTMYDFAVVCPEGEGPRPGRRLGDYSYACPGQISDLMNMPSYVTAKLPWVHFDLNRVYAAGDSMGGLEVLGLLARYPDRLAAVAAMDGVADLATRYAEMRTRQVRRQAWPTSSPRWAARRPRRRSSTPSAAPWTLLAHWRSVTCRCRSGGAPPTEWSSIRRRPDGPALPAHQGARPHRAGDAGRPLSAPRLRVHQRTGLTEVVSSSATAAAGCAVSPTRRTSGATPPGCRTGRSGATGSMPPASATPSGSTSTTAASLRRLTRAA